MSGKVKELILKLEQEKLKVKKLEKEVERLKAMTLSALANKYDKEEPNK
jgi:hypothetical protein